MNKFKSKANTEFAELWLQRLSIMFGEQHNFSSILTKKVNATNISTETLFNIEWLEERSKKKFKEDIIDKLKLEEMKKEINSSEVDFFTPYE